jgi:5,10-methylenetetrahydromethanopterin reductase
VTTPHIGVMFRCTNPPERLIPFSRAAEAAGFDELWLVEDCFYAGGIASVATALAATERITVGIGILPAVARNAAFTAMELAALARLFPGRFHAGLGHGVGAWMRQVGAFPGSQLAALEETTAAVRALLRGERVTMAGHHVRLDGVALDFAPRQTPPVSLGVRGPKSLRMAGRVADGVILAEHASAAYVRWALAQVRAGQAAARRDEEPLRTTVYTFIAMDEDRERALGALRPVLARGIASGQIDMYLQPLGITDEAHALAARGVEALARDLPDAWLNELAVAGTPDDCAAGLARLAAAGADCVVLVPIGDNDMAELAAFRQQLLPRMRSTIIHGGNP